MEKSEFPLRIESSLGRNQLKDGELVDGPAMAPGDEAEFTFAGSRPPERTSSRPGMPVEMRGPSVCRSFMCTGPREYCALDYIWCP
jgi:hypothetical protein